MKSMRCDLRVGDCTLIYKANKDAIWINASDKWFGGITIAEDLISDLVLLGAGATVTVILVPYFTNKWQLHQKSLEIKVSLIQRISNNVMGIMTLIESQNGTNDDVNLELDKEIRKFKVDNKAIGTELESYYPAEGKREGNNKGKDEKIGKDEGKELADNVRDGWDKLRRDILDYSDHSHKFIHKNPHEKNKRKIDDILQIHLEEDCVKVMPQKEHCNDEVEKLKMENCNVRVEDLQKEHCKIIQKKHCIVWVILEAPMPGFSLLPWFIARSRWYRYLALRHFLCRIEKKRL